MSDETTEVTEVVDAPEAIEAPAAEAVPFWQRPNVDRYLAPLIVPALVVVGLVIFVLNLSRVFLSAHGNSAVIVGSVVTAVILIGATIFANSSGMRSQSITLITVGFVLLVLSAGWLVLGHSQVQGEAGGTLPAEGPCNGSLTITANANLTFTPSALTVKTGVYCVTLKDAATQHTLDFDDAKTLFVGLTVNSPGETKMSRVYFGEAGDFTFFCAIPGHRAAGMAGVVTATGDPISLEEAEAQGKPPAG